MKTNRKRKTEMFRGNRWRTRRPAVWSAVTCHRFRVGDLSPANVASHSLTHACLNGREPWMPHGYTHDRLGSPQTNRRAKTMRSCHAPKSEYLRRHPAASLLRTTFAPFHTRPTKIYMRGRIGFPSPLGGERDQGRGVRSAGNITQISSTLSSGGPSPQPFPLQAERENDTPRHLLSPSIVATSPPRCLHPCRPVVSRFRLLSAT